MRALHVSVYACVHAGIFVYICGVEVLRSTTSIFLSDSPLEFLISLNLKLSPWLEWLTSEPQKFSPVLSVQDLLPCLAFSLNVGDQTQVLVFV